MKLSVIIPVYNKWELTSACLSSLAQHTRQPLEVVVVDNGSTDATAQACPSVGAALFGEHFVYLRQESNRNFAPACNMGAQVASGDLLLFLNNDTILTTSWLDPLLTSLAAPPYPTAVGPMLLYPQFAGRPDRVQHLGIAIEPRLYFRHLYAGFPQAHPVCRKPRRYLALTAAALLLSRKTFMEEGRFDEDFINGGEDIEFGLRLSARGHVFTCVPESRIYHLVSQTPGRHAHEEHNAKVLKEKALHRAVPDLHFFVEKDNYQLALTAGLHVYIDLPQRRKDILDKQVERSSSSAELELLLEKEPLCYPAYNKLADMQLAAGLPDAAANTLFLSVTLREDLHVARRLAAVAGMVQQAELAERAAKITAWYARQDIKDLLDTAVFMSGFTEQLQISSVHTLYKDWIHRAEREGAHILEGGIPAQGAL